MATQRRKSNKGRRRKSTARASGGGSSAWKSFFKYFFIVIILSSIAVFLFMHRQEINSQVTEKVTWAKSVIDEEVLDKKKTKKSKSIEGYANKDRAKLDELIKEEIK